MLGVLLPTLASADPGLKVMLDPGHGGSNTGGAGVVSGVYEKRITLALTRLVAQKLAAEGVEVVLTRTGDQYLTLRERVRLANASRADLFVSIHTNASPTKGQRGFETWVLTSEALVEGARALRLGDNPSRPDVAPEVAAILDDVERNHAAVASLRLAARMQARLGAVWGKALDRGVKQGAQDVLIGLTMPGVLVEVGFLDHAEEGMVLLDRVTREALADAIVKAILDPRG
jgi:N-acetylmuramoyl-L-alanine amidase